MFTFSFYIDKWWILYVSVFPLEVWPPNSNRSCNADVTGHQYCYYRLIQVFNANKTKWDWDYFTNYREWGCTTDLDTCERTCSETEGCNRNQSVCCSAQLYQLSGNYSQENHAAYSRCYYGAGSRVDVVMNCQFLVLSILILDWLVRWGRRGLHPRYYRGVLQI